MASITYQNIERRVRMLCRDRGGKQTFDPDMIAAAVDRAMAAVFMELAQPPTLVASFITLVANDYDYTLSSSYKDTDAFGSFRLLSTGQAVLKKDLAVWHQFRRGSTVATGDPVIISFEESAAGSLIARLWPTPWQADTVEATVSSGFVGNAPGVFGANGSALYGSATALDMPGQSMRAVEYRAAAELLASCNKELLDELGVSIKVAPLYLELSAKALQAEIMREARLRRSGEVVYRNAC